MDNAELILQIAETLKKEIGPAVVDNYPKTQAFMASVVLQKIAGELASADSHREAEHLDRQSLIQNMNALLGQYQTPKTISDAVQGLATDGSDENLCQLIEVLYANREALGETVFNEMLGCVRITLRASIDRRMEYAR